MVPAGAVVGWRYWRLPAGQLVGDPGGLRSVTSRGVEWAPGRPLVARCRAAGHRAPAEGCACGIYASSDRDVLLDHGICLGPDPVVLGTVALWGVVVDDGGGALRGEIAYPVTLALVVPEAAAAAEAPSGTVQEALDRLAAYGVPLTTVSAADALGPVSAAIAAFQAMSR